MKNIKSSIVRLLLIVFLLIVGSNLYIGMSAYAEEGGFSGSGDGTKTNPYKITNARQLNEVHNDLKACYVLENDIDLASVNDWKPIGDINEPFVGNFDGKNHIISNLKINCEEKDYIGFFGYCSESTLQNINLTNVSIKLDKKSTDFTESWGGTVYVGGIVAYVNKSKIANCTVDGTISVLNCNDAYVGGIVGSGGGIRNCINEARMHVLSNKDGRYTNDGTVQCGGIVGAPGAVYGSIIECKNYGNVDAISGNYLYCGGISGEYGSIRRCINYGNVCGEITAPSGWSSFAGHCNVGGVVGATSGEVLYSVNHGNVKSCSLKSGSSFAGGIAGFNGYYGGGEINYCVNAGKSIISTGQKENNGVYADINAEVGRIAASSTKTENCYSLDTTTCNNIIPTENIGLNDINGKSLSADELEYVITNSYAGNDSVLETFPNKNEIDVNPKLYGEGYNLSICFKDKVQAIGGEIRLVNLDTGNTEYAFDVGETSSMCFEENILTISNVKLKYGTHYSVQFEEGCVNVGGKAFFGISSEKDWTFTTKDKINVLTDTWSFSNFNGCGKKYWKLWYPSLQAKELSEYVKSSNGGICYGMVLSAMALNSEEQNPADFSKKTVEEIQKKSISNSLGISAVDYIRYMFPLQVAKDVQDAYEYDLEGLYKAVKDFENGENDGVEIGVYGQYWFDKHAGHSLWGIKAIDEKSYSKIAVYDCNHPNDVRYITLNKDSNGNFISWSYDPDLFGASVFGTGQKGNPEIKYISFNGTFYNVLKEQLLGNESKQRTDAGNENLVALSEGKLVTTGVTKIDIRGLIEKTETEAAKNINSSQYYWSQNDGLEVSGNENGISTSLIGKTSGIEVNSQNGKYAKLKCAERSTVQLDTKEGDKMDVTFSIVENDNLMSETEIHAKIAKERATVDYNDTMGTEIKGVSEFSATIHDEIEDDNGNDIVNNENKISIDNLNSNHCYKILEKQISGKKELEVHEDANNDGKFESIIATTRPNHKITQAIIASNYTKTYGNKAFNLGAKAKTKLTYKSSNTKVATVNSSGKVTLKGPGKATITITATATSKYNAATKKITVTVKPKKVTGLKAKNGKKRMTVRWKRDSKVTGYQLTYAQNKKFKKGKKNITIRKNKAVKRTIKKLKARKTYYVKIRAYKKVGKTKIYGAYSKAKKVRVR